ncbi:hypothetical protein [Paracandidimonas lactea]|uniref:hypothetical protein n=1 Tax=Paracandidimonas lactea TaxID=2895524 RepID=UPI001F353ACC|nr:hypothetical protein [Paracandidimonas lactea]
MTIRTPQTIIPRSEGSRVNGIWQDGADLPAITILGSVQPATKGDYDQLQAEQSGRRIERLVRLYTDARLPVAGEDRTNGAILLWEGERYLLVAVSPWRSTALKHYRYLAGMIPRSP